MGGNVLKNLSRRQLEVMNLFWDLEKPLIASKIVELKQELNINTVQSVLRALISKKYIEVDEIVYSGTVLTRSYKAIVTREEYINSISGGMKELLNKTEILMYLIEQVNDVETISEIEKLIEQKRKE